MVTDKHVWLIALLHLPEGVVIIEAYLFLKVPRGGIFPILSSALGRETGWAQRALVQGKRMRIGWKGGFPWGMLAEEKICSRQEQVGVVGGIYGKEEEDFEWDHFTLSLTLDLGSEVVLGICCSLTVLASGGFLITLATLKPKVAYPRPPALPLHPLLRTMRWHTLQLCLVSTVLPESKIHVRWLRHGKVPLLTTWWDGVVLWGQETQVGERRFYLAPPKDIFPPDLPPLLIFPDSFLLAHMAERGFSSKPFPMAIPFSSSFCSLSLFITI